MKVASSLPRRSPVGSAIFSAGCLAPRSLAPHDDSVSGEYFPVITTDLLLPIVSKPKSHFGQRQT
jgi:hypothetical protein